MALYYNHMDNEKLLKDLELLKTKLAHLRNYFDELDANNAVIQVGVAQDISSLILIIKELENKLDQI